MRGKDSVALFVFCFVRITPAYAGKRDSDDNINSELEDHPRLCGEKVSKLTLPSALLGSPPPMRGKVLCSTRDEL